MARDSLFEVDCLICLSGAVREGRADDPAGDQEVKVYSHACLAGWAVHRRFGLSVGFCGAVSDTM